MPRRESPGIIQLEHDRARPDVSVKVLAITNCATGPVSPLAGARLAARGEGNGWGGVAAGRAGDARRAGKSGTRRGPPLRRGCGPAEPAVMSESAIGRKGSGAEDRQSYDDPKVPFVPRHQRHALDEGACSNQGILLVKRRVSLPQLEIPRGDCLGQLHDSALA